MKNLGNIVRQIALVLQSNFMGTEIEPFALLKFQHLNF